MSGDRTSLHDRATEDDDRTAERVEGLEENRSMLDIPKTPPDEQIQMYFNPEVAKSPKGLSSGGREERLPAPIEAHSLSTQSLGSGKRRRSLSWRNVRQISSFTLTGIEEEAHGVPAPQTSTAEMRKCPPS